MTSPGNLAADSTPQVRAMRVGGAPACRANFRGWEAPTSGPRMDSSIR
jgi:hypothetical protein